jgi:hypothetical protein
MREYILSPSTFSILRRRTLIGVPIMMTLIFVSVLYGRGAHLRDPATYFTVGIGGIAAFIGLQIAIRQQRRFCDTFRIVLDDHTLVRKIEGYPDIEMRRADITSVVVNKSGDVVIKAGSKQLPIRGT